MGRNDARRLGKYMVLERVAEGPLTEVLRARLDGIAGFSRIFAIKRVRSEIALNADAVALVEAQAREAAILSHGNIVQLLDLGREKGQPYIVLEWVDGWSLAAVLAQATERAVSMPVGHAAWIGLQVLRALEYAHHRDILRDGTPAVLHLIHGAVCPEDVLVSRGGEVKLTDFGLARATDQVAALDPTLVTPRVALRAPELAAGGDPTVAADLWGAARVVRACLLTGVSGDTSKPVHELRSDIPEAFALMLDSALSDDPALRPAHATEMKAAFTDLLHGLGDVFTADTLARWIADAKLAPPEPTRDPSEGLPDLGLPLDDVTDENVGLDFGHPDDQTSPVSMDDGIVFDEDARTQVQAAIRPTPAAPPEEAWDEQGATTVNPELARRLAELRDKAEPGSDAQDVVHVRPTAFGEIDLTETDQDAPVQAAWRGGLWLGLVTLAAGIVLGGVGATLWGRDAGITVNAPMLDVRAAPDVSIQVAVDGLPVTGPTTLVPGKHQLRVDVAGASPWLVDLTLQAGEYRLMLVEANRITVADPAATTAPE